MSAYRQVKILLVEYFSIPISISIFIFIFVSSFPSLPFHSLPFPIGFDYPFSGGNSDILCTIFSASNYGGGGNSGAYMVFTKDPHLNHSSGGGVGVEGEEMEGEIMIGTGYAIPIQCCCCCCWVIFSLDIY